MKIKLTKYVLVLALVGSSFTGKAYADTLVLNPVFDSTIRSDQADTTQSASAVLFAGDTTSAFLRSVLLFDLNQPELTGATINSATLTLTVRTNDGNNPGTTIDVNLHELSGAFDDGVTWNTRDGSTSWATAGGDFGSVLDSITGDPGNAIVNNQFEFTSASLTSYVSAASGGDLGFLLKSGSEDNAFRNLFWFRSKESVGTIPFLTIDYTTALPGDTDGDGDIDDSDLGTSFANYTGPVGGAGGKTAADGDTDGDGDVDDSDLGTAFSGYTGPLGPASVPEPTSLALVAIGGLLVVRRRRG